MRALLRARRGWRVPVAEISKPLSARLKLQGAEERPIEHP
jgi:hypothetical protein